MIRQIEATEALAHEQRVSAVATDRLGQKMWWSTVAIAVMTLVGAVAGVVALVS